MRVELIPPYPHLSPLRLRLPNALVTFFTLDGFLLAQVRFARIIHRLPEPLARWRIISFATSFAAAAASQAQFAQPGGGSAPLPATTTILDPPSGSSYKRQPDEKDRAEAHDYNDSQLWPEEFVQVKFWGGWTLPYVRRAYTG